MKSFFIVITFLSTLNVAEGSVLSATASDCSAMEVFDIAMQMCMPVAMKEMQMTMLMVHGNAFATEISESGARGRSAFAVPHFFMADLGTTLGSAQYLNLDYMGTLERWTLPENGYPELLQIGEENNAGIPYLDAQHPHSSPIMGLTLSDTITFDNTKNRLKIFAAPRGEATDGPIAFMHRPTGVVNPDAPLGHHVGQDVGHISSTVVGESLTLGATTFESSTYHGAEPQPQSTDIPLGNLDSYSLRLIATLSPEVLAMASYAYVSSPEASDPSVGFENRYSASVYSLFKMKNDIKFDNALIWGAVSNYDSAATLTSFAEEFLLSCGHSSLWGRLEILQRTPGELQIQTATDPNVGQWVTAATLGYTHRLAGTDIAELALGGSVTADFLPQDYQSAYSGNPWSGKIFLQMSAMKMWNL